MNLTIDQIPNTDPPKFRWKRRISTPIGMQTLDCEGMLPVAVETAVAQLIRDAKELLLENRKLKSAVDLYAARLAKQEGVTPQEPEPTSSKPVSSSRKGRA